MQEGHRALIGRAAAAVGVSVVLHLAVAFLGGSLPLGTLLGTAWHNDADPVIVEMVAGDARRSEPRRAARVARHRPVAPPARSQAAPPVPATLPRALPASAQDAPPPPAPSPTAGAPATLEMASAHPDPAAADLALPGDTTSPAGSATDGGEDGTSRLALTGGIAPPPGSIASNEASLARPDEEVAAAESAAAAPTQVATAPAMTASREDVAAVTEGSPAPRDPSALGESDPRMDRARLDAVVRNPSVSARTAGAPFVGRREVFEFLLDHPEFATHVTRALRVARYRIWRTEDGLFVDDGWGATGQMFVVRAGSGTRVLYARGEYQHKLLPVITGEAVVTINYDARPAGDGRDLLLTDISSQLRIDGPFGELIVKLASTVATEKAEKESRRLVHIFARVLKAVDERPAALYASLRERPDVPQRELEQFRVLLKLP